MSLLVAREAGRGSSTTTIVATTTTGNVEATIAGILFVREVTIEETPEVWTDRGESAAAAVAMAKPRQLRSL